MNCPAPRPVSARDMTYSTLTGGTGIVSAPAGGAAVLPELDSGAGPAFQPGGQEWPRRTALELAALPTAVPCARLHARAVLYEWRLAAIAETAELIVSELVTNAVAVSAGTGLPVRLRLVAGHLGVLVEVEDASQQVPQQQAVAPDAEHGRGLLLVDALSARWGVYPLESGKIVWAVVEPYGAR